MRYTPIRKIIRLQGYDYSKNGAYFVTICIKDKMKILGDNTDGKIILSKIGTIVHEHWQSIPNHFPQIALDEYVIMPDHFHGIIIINNDFVVPYMGDRKNTISKTNIPESLTFPKHHLGIIINQFKRACTIEIRKSGFQFAWQSRFYEHIIRDDNDLQRIREYIQTNPLKHEIQYESP